MNSVSEAVSGICFKYSFSHFFYTYAIFRLYFIYTGTIKIQVVTTHVLWFVVVVNYLYDNFQGDYEIDATIIDTTTGEEVACYHIEVSVGEGCKGFGCLIGKKRK